MNIVLAPDKFKGSLTGLEFCNAVAQGLKKVLPDAEIIKLPLADGGDGTIEVVNYYLNGRTIELKVNNPFFKPVKASYLFSDPSKIAFIEMAEASGVKILTPSELDVKNATTLGTGELILNAIEKGVRTIILGIGGSATNDCGIGMATALGYRFLDENNKEVIPVGKHLSEIVSIDDSKVHPKLKEVKFKIACDVSNPLYGKNGAAFVYARQKGATDSEIEMLNRGLQSFSKVIDNHFEINCQEIKGAGAAGGMGIASFCFLNGKLEPGINFIKELAEFDNKIVGADLIITGEGKLDSQTFSGKTIKGVVDSANKNKIPVAVFCGSNDLNEYELNQFGINFVDSVINRAENFQDAMNNSYDYLREMTVDFINQIK